MMVLFVGDEPSKKNTDQNVAFVGTKSFDRLIGWARKSLDIASHNIVLVNSISTSDWLTIGLHCGYGSSIIALGNRASGRLQKQRIEHFLLPHPSGRNRKLNNKEYVDSELRKCYLWLKERDQECAKFAMTGNPTK